MKKIRWWMFEHDIKAWKWMEPDGLERKMTMGDVLLMTAIVGAGYTCIILWITGKWKK